MLNVIGGRVQRRGQANDASFQETAARPAIAHLPYVNFEPASFTQECDGVGDIIRRNAETARKVVARAGRNNAQRRLAADESERDIFNRAVAAGNDHHFRAGAGGAARDRIQAMFWLHKNHFDLDLLRLQTAQ